MAFTEGNGCSIREVDPPEMHLLNFTLVKVMIVSPSGALSLRITSPVLYIKES